MDPVFILGVVAGVILVLGAAYPGDDKVKPRKSVKNWLLLAGSFLLFVYALLNYFAGGAIFFVFLQGLVILAGVLMMLGVSECVSSVTICISAISLILWSLTYFEDYSTLIFIFGLSGIGLGYVTKAVTVRRNLMLLLGSILIALFSYFEADWVFFWLNVFFALFAGYYVWKLARKAKSK